MLVVLKRLGTGASKGHVSQLASDLLWLTLSGSDTKCLLSHVTTRWCARTSSNDCPAAMSRRAQGGLRGCKQGVTHDCHALPLLISRASLPAFWMQVSN